MMPSSSVWIAAKALAQQIAMLGDIKALLEESRGLNRLPRRRRTTV